MSEYDIHYILSRLPHRYPFVLVDKIVDVTPGESIHCLKNVTINEPFFTGHFPDRPVMPGVLILEALAQASGLLYFITHEDDTNSSFLHYFAGIDNARFKHIVLPGDQIQLRVSLTKSRMELWRLSAEASVDENVVCSADLMIVRKDI